MLANEKPTTNLILVFDASGSMFSKIDGKAKMVIAKEVLSELVQDIPDKNNLGLIVYGSRHLDNLQ